MIAPAAWGQPMLRACNVCVHGRCASGLPARPGGEGAASCTSPAVTGRSDRGMPIEIARAQAGPCGPEASQQEYPGFEAPRSIGGCRSGEAGFRRTYRFGAE